MKQYLNMLRRIMADGDDREDRTGVGTRSVFGYQLEFYLQCGFPLLTTKKLHLRSIIYELLWFLEGKTDVKWLNDRGVTIWDEWATEEKCAKWGRPAGELGPIYGMQWRGFRTRNETIDQITRLIYNINHNPNSRRLLVSAWNPEDVERVDLPPCHVLFQIYVNKDHLSCHVYQRSADAFLGVPFNIASYALLTHMIAQVTGKKVGKLVISFGDLHVYQNHFNQVRTQLSRFPRKLPSIDINPDVKGIFNFRYEDFSLVEYDPWPAIKADIAV